MNLATPITTVAKHLQIALKGREIVCTLYVIHSLFHSKFRYKCWNIQHKTEEIGIFIDKNVVEKKLVCFIHHYYGGTFDSFEPNHLDSNLVSCENVSQISDFELPIHR